MWLTGPADDPRESFLAGNLHIRVFDGNDDRPMIKVERIWIDKMR